MPTRAKVNAVILAPTDQAEKLNSLELMEGL
jgi:hypothetical protein